MIILVLNHQQLQAQLAHPYWLQPLQQLPQLAVNILIILVMGNIVTMETIMKIVHGMEETVVEVMLTQITVQLVNV